VRPPAPSTLAAPCYVVSDAHLGAAGPEVEVRLLDFLESLEDAGSLVVNGDLVDFWFEWRHVVPRSGYRVVAALSSMARRGTSIVWVAGNHDCWGGDVVRDAGIHFTEGPWRGSLAGWRAHVEHGDGLRGPEDRGYRALRRVLRNRWAIRAFRLLHPDWGRTYRAPDEGVGLQRVAVDRLAAEPDLDLVIFGHSHVAALEQAPAGTRGVYANAGEWLVDPTYLRIESDVIELRRWHNGTGERVTGISRTSVSGT
jgi:UDP-2,3-diacylglucosamine hydrolase